jgi:gas vesicle protein
MNRKVKLTGIGMVLLTALIFSACNQQAVQQESNADKNLRELKTELKQLGEAIENTSQKTGEEFKDDALQILNDFNMKVDNFEQKLKESGEEIDMMTRASIDELKDQGEKVRTKLDQFGDDTQQDMEELKAEMKHDFTEFGNSMKDFFSDNV